VARRLTAAERDFLRRETLRYFPSLISSDPAIAELVSLLGVARGVLVHLLGPEAAYDILQGEADKVADRIVGA
jgi:hypothetical protein